MNRRTSFGIVSGLLIGLLWGPGAVAADKGDRPDPLLLPKSPMQWRMTIEPTSGGTAMGGDEVIAIDYLHGGDVTKMTVSTPSGARDYWTAGGYALYMASNGKIRLIRPSPNAPAPYPYPAEGFYGMGNVKAAHELAEETFAGEKCRHFRGPVSVKSFEANGFGGSLASMEYEAWFDARTGLPKGYCEKDRLFTFEFAPAPSEVKLPPEWKAAYDRNQADLRRLGLLPPDGP